MKYAVILAALLLGACAQSEPKPQARDMTLIQNECGGPTKPFPVVWACMRPEVAAIGKDGGEGSDILELFLAKGDFIAQQTSTGRMTDVEGRLALAQARTQALASTRTRLGAQAPAPRAPLFPPMTVYRPDQGTSGTTLPQSTIINTSRGTVVCHRTGSSSVFCS